MQRRYNLQSFQQFLLKYMLLALAIIPMALVGCEGESTAPDTLISPSSSDARLFRGSIADSRDFEPLSDSDTGMGGKYAIYGRNIEYNETDGTITVDISVVNISDSSYLCPIINFSPSINNSKFQG